MINSSFKSFRKKFSCGHGTHIKQLMAISFPQGINNHGYFRRKRHTSVHSKWYTHNTSGIKPLFCLLCETETQFQCLLSISKTCVRSTVRYHRWYFRCLHLSTTWRPHIGIRTVHHVIEKATWTNQLYGYRIRQSPTGGIRILRGYLKPLYGHFNGLSSTMRQYTSLKPHSEKLQTVEHGSRVFLHHVIKNHGGRLESMSTSNMECGGQLNATIAQESYSYRSAGSES